MSSRSGPTAPTPLDRAVFPVTDRWAYLNHAGITPLPAPALDAMHGCATQVAIDGGLAYPAQAERVEEVRASAARLMGVPTTDVAFVKNTTEGLGFVANGLAWEEGDRVVVPDHEFPSTVYPWLALAERGVVVDVVEPAGAGRRLPADSFAQVMDQGPVPKLVALSWVQFGRGWRTDLAALASICHDAGALLCADVIQGLGVIPAELEAWGVDFAMADGHKWLLGPPGIGVLYVRRSCLDQLRPLEPGWASVPHREQWDNLELVFDDTARRLEGGTPNLVGTYGLGASLDLLLDAGVGTVWDHVSALTDLACEGLAGIGATVMSDRSPEGRSGVVTFEVEGRDPAAVVAALQGRGVVCSPRAGGVRLSPHGYNTAEDVDRLVAVVAEVVSGG